MNRPTQTAAVCVVLVVVVFCPASLLARLWTDSTGRYTLEASLVAFNQESVVLQRADHELVAVQLDKLSEHDRAYLESQPARELANKSLDRPQTWELRDGTKIVGRIVDYKQAEISLQRRRSRIYVNDRPLANLPEFYQLLIPKIVAHFENLREATPQSLERWLIRQRGERRTFPIEGVVLEFENGDEYGIPFFLFSDDDQLVLHDDWQAWQAAHRNSDFDMLGEHAFRLQSLAAARQHDRLVQRQIAMLQLQLQAVQTGLTSLWEVTLYPRPGRGGRPIWVVMPGRDSRQAAAAALEQNPGFVVGPVRRVAGG